MGKISNMSLQAILNQIDIGFKREDIEVFCSDQNVRNEIIFMTNEGRDFKDVLLRNEDKIDKEKLVLISYQTFKEKLEDKDEYEQMSEQEIRDIKNSMQRIKKLAKGMDTYIAIAHKGKKLIEWIEVISAKNAMAGIPTLEKRNREIFDAINKELASDDEVPGMNYAIQCIEMSDLEEVLPCKDIAKAMEYSIAFNSNVKGNDILEKIKQLRDSDENEEEINELQSRYAKEILIPEKTSSIEGVLGYIDMPKLLLISIYRFEELMNSAAEGTIEIDDTVLDSVKNISDQLIKYINKNTKISNENYTYAYADAIDFISRMDLANGVYFTKEEIKDLEERLLNGADLAEMDEEEATKLSKLRLSEEQLEKIMKISPTNFAFAVTALKLSTKEIIEKGIKNKEVWSDEITKDLLLDGKISSKDLFKLYANDMISVEFLREDAKEIDMNSEISLDIINQEYLELANKKEQDPKKTKLLEKRIELFKKLKLEGKTEKELQESSDNLMYEMAEKLQDEDNILFLYNNGLITLQTLSIWCDTQTLDKLYTEGKITFEDIESLEDKQIKQAILGKEISSKMEEYEQEDLLKYINLGYLSEQDIYKAFKLALLNDTYAEDMLNNGIISAKTYIDILDIGKEELEKQTNTSASNLEVMPKRDFVLTVIGDDEMEESSLSIGSIPDSKKDLIIAENKKQESKGYAAGYKRTETLINPEIRWAYLKALKCKYPADRNFAHDNPESPFYDYEFFIIENIDEKGQAQKDSIVIGERIYKDKNTQYEFATSNATYVWQYKDYLIAKKAAQSERKNKTAITQETNGVVYKAIHKPDSWAINLLYKIAQAKAGRNFNEYKGDEKRLKILEQLEKLYSPQEIMDILDMASIIDNEPEMIDQNGNKVGIVFEVINEGGAGRRTSKKAAPNFEDDDDECR